MTDPYGMRRHGDYLHSDLDIIPIIEVQERRHELRYARAGSEVKAYSICDEDGESYGYRRHIS
ncbi:MAG: hypothetical protein ACE5FV_12375 [Woeseia sp.]